MENEAGQCQVLKEGGVPGSEWRLRKSVEKARVVFRGAGSLQKRLRDGLKTAVRSRAVGHEAPRARDCRGESQASVGAGREVENVGGPAAIGTTFQRAQGKGGGQGGWRLGQIKE